MIIQKRLRDILREVAHEFDISLDTAYRVYMSEFKYVHDEISNSDKSDKDSFKSIQLRYLGTFGASNAAVTRAINKNKNKDEGHN